MMELFIVHKEGKHTIDWESMERALVKLQDNIRETISSGDSDEYASFLELTHKWWSMLVTKLPDGTLQPTDNGLCVEKKAIADYPKEKRPPDDDCARPYKRGKWDDIV